MSSSSKPHFEKAEEYQKEYEEIEYKINYTHNEDTISSLRLLVEEMIETIKYLEEHLGRNS